MAYQLTGTSSEGMSRSDADRLNLGESNIASLLRSLTRLAAGPAVMNAVIPATAAAAGDADDADER